MESVFDINWQAPTEVPELLEGAAQIWCASIDQPFSVYFDAKSHLSTDEQVKAARFRHEQSRKQFVLGRGLLRRFLGHYLNEHPSEISFVYGDYGKPLLFHPMASNIRFNVSHAGELVMLGFSLENDIGIDVEQVRPVPEADVIAERFFVRTEVAALQASGNGKRDTFFRIWTRKEAVLKCEGSGFGETKFDRSDAMVCELCPAPGYMAAVAINARQAKIQTWQWTPELILRQNAAPYPV